MGVVQGKSLNPTSFMQSKTVWLYNSNNLENTSNFAAINQWWSNLDGKDIIWRQRLIPSTGDPSQLDWETQRFDERFVIFNPQIRGITLYWKKADSPQERSTTPHQLELDPIRQCIYIYPQSQKEVVIRVELAGVIAQTIEMNNPQLQVSSTGENRVLTLIDLQQKLQVQVTLTPENIDRLKQQL